MKNILVTGGSGFIGSNVINYLLNLNTFNVNVINVDKLIYAESQENLKAISGKYLNSSYFFEHVNITGFDALEIIFKKIES